MSQPKTIEEVAQTASNDFCDKFDDWNSEPHWTFIENIFKSGFNSGHAHALSEGLVEMGKVEAVINARIEALKEAS